MKTYGPLIFAAFTFGVMIFLTWLTNERRKRRHRKNKVDAEQNFEMFQERINNFDKRLERSDLGIELINKKLDFYVKETETKKAKKTGDNPGHSTGETAN